MKTFADWMEHARKLEHECENEDLNDDGVGELYRQAAMGYARACALEPDNADAHFDWGRCALVVSDFTDDDDLEERATHLSIAVEKLRRSLQLKADSGPCMFNLAKALIAEGDVKAELHEEGEEDESLPQQAKSRYEEAIELLSKVYEVQKSDIVQGLPADSPTTKQHLTETLISQAGAHASIASLAEKAEDYEPLYEKAIDRLKVAIEEDPDSKGMLLQEWASLLEARLDKRMDEDESAEEPDLAEVINKLNEAVEADPSSPSPHVDLAELYLRKGQHVMIKAALDSNQEGAEGPVQADSFSDDVESRVWDSYKLAVSHIEKAYAAEPTSTGIIQQTGDIYYQTGRLMMKIAKPSSEENLRKSEEMYRKGVEEDDDDEELVVRLANVVFHIGGRDAEVAELLNKYHELGGSIDELLDDPEIFDEDFLAKVSDVIPEDQWEDVDDEDGDESDDDD